MIDNQLTQNYEQCAEYTQAIPVVPLRGGAVFPGVTTTISIGRRRSLSAAQAAVEKDGRLLILIQYNAEVENPEKEDLTQIGILATVRDVLRTPHMGIQMLVELHHRVRFIGMHETEPFLTGYYEEITNEFHSHDDTIIAEAIAYLEQYADTLGEANQQILATIRSKTTAGELADYIAGLLNMPFETELDLLNTINGVTRLQIATSYLQQELRIAEIKTKIQKDAREGADKAQREYLLREQMRAQLPFISTDSSSSPT